MDCSLPQFSSASSLELLQLVVILLVLDVHGLLVDLKFDLNDVDDDVEFDVEYEIDDKYDKFVPELKNEVQKMREDE